MFILCCSIGLITPPVGNVLNVVSSVTKVPFERAVLGILPYAGILIVLMFILLIFPDIVIVPMEYLTAR